MNDLYDSDILLWSEQQAGLLRRIAVAAACPIDPGLHCRFEKGKTDAAGRDHFASYCENKGMGISVCFSKPCSGLLSTICCDSGACLFKCCECLVC